MEKANNEVWKKLGEGVQGGLGKGKNDNSKKMFIKKLETGTLHIQVVGRRESRNLWDDLTTFLVA